MRSQAPRYHAVEEPWNYENATAKIEKKRDLKKIVLQLPLPKGPQGEVKAERKQDSIHGHKWQMVFQCLLLP